MQNIIIAIDGYSSSGKSTMARRLAAEIGYRYVDSGAMYRAVTLWALRHNQVCGQQVDTAALVADLPRIEIDFALQPDGSQHTLLCGEDVEQLIRTIEVSNAVSPVAAIPAVRTALVTMQQQMGRSKGIVMDGRDIGTTVFPQAELKIYVNAPAETRARRRYDELTAKGQQVSYQEVLDNVQQRDYIDTHRDESPLRMADDAVALDNSNMTLEQQHRWLVDLFNQTMSRLDA